MARKQIFGHIPGVFPGTTYSNRNELSKSGVHVQTQAGIAGSADSGADSIVVSGGYKDDRDEGEVIVYTGHGGRDANGKHVEDQKLIRGNRALTVSGLEGLPVRVVRGADRKNPFAPKVGYRYDGLFRVEDHWSEQGQGGFKIWRFRLVQLFDAHDAPPAELLLKTKLSGGNEIPIRKTVTTQRIIRDTKQSKNLKLLYSHKCQVCGTRIETASGAYAEAAHIQPLGLPHNGPDTPDNIICLCPNHHVMFDFGAFSIANDLSLIGISGKLTINSRHNINQTYLEYHRQHYLDQS